MSMLIETGNVKKLVKTMDDLRPHCTPATNELNFVLKKWADRALSYLTIFGQIWDKMDIKCPF